MNMQSILRYPKIYFPNIQTFRCPNSLLLEQYYLNFNCFCLSKKFRDIGYRWSKLEIGENEQAVIYFHFRTSYF